MPAGKRTLSQWVKFANSPLAACNPCIDECPDLASRSCQSDGCNCRVACWRVPDETVAVSTESGYKNPLGTVNEGWGEVFMGADGSVWWDIMIRDD